jgi:FkbM family methyltransferase
MGLVERVPAPALRWAGRQQFRPVIGPVVKALSGRLARGPRTVAHGRAAGLRIDPRGAAAGYALGTSEPLIQEAFAELVRPGAVVWDVGANIGFYTLIAARLVERGRVIAFEPLPENQAAIRANLELNGLTNVELAGIALADRAGDAELQMHGESTWAKLDTSEDTSFKRDSDATGSVPVEVSTLDAGAGPRQDRHRGRRGRRAARRVALARAVPPDADLRAARNERTGHRAADRARLRRADGRDAGRAARARRVVRARHRHARRAPVASASSVAIAGRYGPAIAARITCSNSRARAS